MPLEADALELLRAWWHSAHPPSWLFAGRDGSQPVNDATVQKWYQAARAKAGITKRGGIHTLRHCYATHMLESGADLYSLSQWLVAPAKLVTRCFETKFGRYPIARSPAIESNGWQFLRD